MTIAPTFNDLEVGFDIPAAPGMAEADIQTPCLVVDLAALERNIAKMQRFADEMGVRLRVHGKMHKSADVSTPSYYDDRCCFHKFNNNWILPKLSCSYNNIIICATLEMMMYSTYSDRNKLGMYLINKEMRPTKNV